MTVDTRIVIVGGGIIGCSILYHLAKAGCSDCVLLERAELTAGATWHAAGNTHTQSGVPNMSRLQSYSLKLYSELESETGQAVGTHTVGGFFLAQNSARMEEFSFLASKFRYLGLDYEVVTPSEVKEKHPLINTDGLVGALWDPGEGYVDPYSVTMALASGARSRGAIIRRHERVLRIERQRDGWLVATAGNQYRCETIVNAAGFWANEVAQMVGSRLPIVNMEHQYLVTERIPEIEAHHEELPMIRDTDADFYLRQEGMGLLAGPWESNCRAAWDGKPAPWSFGQELFENDLDRIETGLEKVCHRIPAFGEVGLKRVVNGAISFSPDAMPMIGPMPGNPGFYVAAGFLGGIAQGGGIGLAMSQWILNGESELDLSRVDVARFGDWTTPEFARRRVFEVLPKRYEIIYPYLERGCGRDIRMTPIHDRLKAHGAVFGQAYGWERPLWFAQIPGAKDEPCFRRTNWFDTVGRECLAVRDRVGLVDMSTYCKFEISGPDADRFLDKITTNKLPQSTGRIVLTLMLNSRGGIVGDFTLTKLSMGKYYLVGATLGEATYQRWMARQAQGFDVKIDCVTDRWMAIGITGPKSRAMLSQLHEGLFRNDTFGFMQMRELDVAGVPCRVLRVSYSGELGWEFHCAKEPQPKLFDALMAAGASCDLALIGSRAMGNLRLEKGYRSWGPELNTEFTPSMVGLQWLCKPEKGEFIGRHAFLSETGQPLPGQIATVVVDADDADCVGSEAVWGDNRVIGYVTSGGYGWRIGRSIAMVYIDPSFAVSGTRLQVEVLGRRLGASVVDDPLYDPKNIRLTS